MLACAFPERGAGPPGHRTRRHLDRLQFINSDVDCPNQPQLFQAGIGEPPTATLVRPNTMSEHARKCAFGFNQSNANHFRTR